MKKPKKHIESWLSSKQKTTRSLKLLRKYEECYDTINWNLRTKVIQHVKNNRTQIGKALYKTRDCYVDNMDIEEFQLSITNTINADILKELIEKSIDRILKKDVSLKKRFSREDVRIAIELYAFYQPYVGYAFEQRIKDLIENNTTYKVNRSSSLDKNYAIDMQLIDYDRGIAIGLQLKSKSFLNVSKDNRKSYYCRNREAIWLKLGVEVYYVFHDKYCNIISSDCEILVDYKTACTSMDTMLIAEDEEEFLKELHRAFDICVQRVREGK